MPGREALASCDVARFPDHLALADAERADAEAFRIA
jgi:hypothetical protein